MISPATNSPDVAAEGNHQLPAAPLSGPNAGALLKALRRRWLLASSLGFLTATLAALLIWFLLPTTYTVRALLDVAASPPKVIFSTNENRGDPFSTFQKKQVALIKSRPVLATALGQPKVAELNIVREQLDPIEWLENRIQADYSVAPEILRIALSGDRPEELVVLVDAVTEAYLQEIVNKEHKRRLQRLDQLKELYNNYDEELRKKRQALRDLAAKVGSGDAKTLALKHQFAIEQLHMAEKELMDIQSQLRKLQVEAADQQAQEKGSAELPIPDSAVEQQIEKDRIVQQYLKQVADLENRIEDLRVVSVPGGNEPIFRRYRADIESAKAAVAARRKEIRPQITEELRNKSRTELTANVAFLKSRGTLLYKHEKVLIDLIDRLRTETNSMNQSELNLGTLQDDIPRAENLFKTVAAELDALNVELQAPPRVSLLEGASSSQKDNKKRKALAAGMAAFGAFGLALFSVSWWEFRRQRVNTVDEVVHGLGGNLLGAVPHLPERARHSLVASNSLVPSNGTPDLYWQNLLIESVNTVRIMLLHAARIEPLRVIMVTSASGGEGKTSLSSHLALSLARSGRKVLLIDCDMRRPSVHRTFGHPLNPGFSELLCGEVDISVAVQPGPVNDLWLLPAGQSSSHAIEALAKEGVPSIFNRLREQFDFIVVDSCPILPVADSLLIAQHVDGVIFTMLREVSRLPQVYAGYQRLAALGVRILGIVVNGAGGDVYGSTYSEYQYLHPSSN